MSWHAPTTYKELTESISRGWSFTSERFGLRGERIEVLTSHGRDSLGLDVGHELSRKVTESAERRTEKYLAGGTRQPEPDMHMYYVATTGHLGRVFVAVTASGDVAWASSHDDSDGDMLGSRMGDAVDRLAAAYAAITDNNEWT